MVHVKYYCIFQEVTPIQGVGALSDMPASPRVTKRRRYQPRCVSRTIEDFPPVVHSYLAPPDPAVASVDSVWCWFLHDKEANM